MLVVLPTYKRVDQLKWSLLSVLKADKPLGEESRLCVVSNDPGSHDKVGELLKKCVQDYDPDRSWNVKLVQRIKTLDPVDNWYSAIKENANEGEVVFLHGDDDIMLPWGLVKRHNKITESKAMILLCPHVSGLLFDGNEYCYPASVDKKLNIEDKARNLSFADSGLGNSPFIGNHCYKYNKDFRETLDVTFQSCAQQRWLDHNTSTLMLPFYLPLFAIHLGYQVDGIQTRCVARGQDVDEVINSKYACRSWNNAMLYAATLDVMTNGPLGKICELESLRMCYRDMILRGFATLYFDKRVNAVGRDITLSKISRHISGHYIEKIMSMRYVVSDVLRLRRVRIKNQLSNLNKIKTSDWVMSLGCGI